MIELEEVSATAIKDTAIVLLGILGFLVFAGWVLVWRHKRRMRKMGFKNVSAWGAFLPHVSTQNEWSRMPVRDLWLCFVKRSVAIGYFILAVWYAYSHVKYEVLSFALVGVFGLVFTWRYLGIAIAHLLEHFGEQKVDETATHVIYERSPATLAISVVQLGFMAAISALLCYIYCIKVFFDAIKLLVCIRRRTTGQLDDIAIDKSFDDDRLI